MEKAPSKPHIISQVIEIFNRVIGIFEPGEIVAETNIVKDIKVDTDDLSIFAAEVEKHFGFKTPPGAWPQGFEPTIDGIADFVLLQLDICRAK